MHCWGYWELSENTSGIPRAHPQVSRPRGRTNPFPQAANLNQWQTFLTLFTYTDQGTQSRVGPTAGGQGDQSHERPESPDTQESVVREASSRLPAADLGWEPPPRSAKWGALSFGFLKHLNTGVKRLLSSHTVTALAFGDGSPSQRSDPGSRKSEGSPSGGQEAERGRAWDVVQQVPQDCPMEGRTLVITEQCSRGAVAGRHAAAWELRLFGSS